MNLTISRGGEEFRRGRASAGFSDGNLNIRITIVSAPVENATVCLRNVGAHRVALGGTRLTDAAASLDGKAIRARVEIEYLRGRQERWWDIASLLAKRVGIVRASFVGGWSLWIGAALIAAAWIVALRLLLREAQQ
jgi:hypothetical protein